MSLFLKSHKSDLLKLLFCKEWQKRYAHRGSFVKSEWEQFTHGQWSLFFKMRREQIGHSRSLKRLILSEIAKSKGAKERVPNPATCPSSTPSYNLSTLALLLPHLYHKTHLSSTPYSFNPLHLNPHPAPVNHNLPHFSYCTVQCTPYVCTSNRI